MLLPLLNCLSLSDREGDANGDSAPPPPLPTVCFLLPVCCLQSNPDWRTGWGSTPPHNQAWPDGGWLDLVGLGKGYFERVPEHLSTTSVMPKRETRAPCTGSASCAACEWLAHWHGQWQSLVL